MNIIETMDDPALFAKFFQGDSWRAWRAVLKAMFAIPMTAAERRLFGQLAGGRRVPRRQIEELWAVVGRRGGKSRVIALVAVFLACFRKYSEYLAEGELACVLVLASDKRQARAVFRYATALIAAVPMLRRRIVNQTQEEIELSNSVVISIQTANFRAVRSYTVACCIADEVAYWRSDESANPDVEIIEALRPAMATIPGAMLLGISSGYRKHGVLFDAYREHFGKDSAETLVIQSDARTMNPTLRQATIDRAYRRDPTRAAAEWGGSFRDDLQAFLEEAWIDAAIVTDRPADLSPRDGITYRAFADASGGRRDAFTVAIGHMEGKRVVIDLVRGRRPPFRPQNVVKDFAEILKRYPGCRRLTGDRYSAAWVSSAFEDAGIEYVASDLSKSEIYLEAEPLFPQGEIEIPDGPAVLELRQLERRTGRGRDVVDHPVGGNDDHANSLLGAAWLVMKLRSAPTFEGLDLGDLQKQSTWRRSPGQSNSWSDR